jgi:Ca-activated chloride channel homolog
MRRKTRNFGKIVLPVLLLLALAASAQDYKLRAKVDLVEVPVTVKGAGDKLIAGLGKDDFIVFEDGRPQTISTFTPDPVPLSAAVIVDTGLLAGSLSKVQDTFSALAGAFSEFDEVAVYRYDKFVEQVLNFSNDAETIVTAMKTLRSVKPDAPREADMPRGPFSIPGPVINGAAVVPPGQIGVITTIPPKNSKVLHDAIFTAAADLSKRERNRRRIVLVISDGNTRGSNHSFDETTQELLSKHVQVFAVGLDQPGPYKKVSVLKDYANATGGDAFFANSLLSIEQAYLAAGEEARNQYVIGYLSNNEVTGQDPVFREIAVEARGANLRTLHRKGYYQYP